MNTIDAEDLDIRVKIGEIRGESDKSSLWDVFVRCCLMIIGRLDGLSSS